MNATILTLVGICAASTLIAAETVAPAPAAPLPRFKLEPGQELVYEGSSEFKHDSGSHKTTEAITYWVTRFNPNGSWHLIARCESSFVQTFSGSGPTELPAQKDATIASFDLRPDGRIENLPENYQTNALRGPFTELPADLPTALKGWEISREVDAKQIYRLLPESDPGAGKWNFSETEEGLFNIIYVSTSNAVIHFDAGRGLVTARDGTYTQDYGFHGKGTSKLELKSVNNKPKEWIDQLAGETAVLEEARKATEAMAEDKKDKPADLQEKSKRLLTEGRAKVKLPEIAAQFDSDLNGLTESAKYEAKDKEREEAVMNKPAADWETTDLGGKKQRLADYRGKVVLLDFWYRGCGWCIKAMPQIKEVADHYRDKPVAVLGMNTDREDKDAQFVVDKLQLNYPTLKATGLPEKYGVQGFPTLIIIDADGVVRARHVGYSRTLREELIKTVDGLMPGGK